MKCETSTIVNLVFPSIVVFLKNSFNVVSLSPSDSLSIFSGREASLLFNFTLQTRPSSAVTAKSVVFFNLRCVMTQVVPLLPPGGGDAVEGLGIAAPSHPLLPETPEELVGQRAAPAEERLGHPTNQRARKLQRPVPAHARQSE